MTEVDLEGTPRGINKMLALERMQRLQRLRDYIVIFLVSYYFPANVRDALSELELYSFSDRDRTPFMQALAAD